MHVSQTVHAEPLDTLDNPAYRVNFWVPTAEGAWALDAYVLFDVDDVGAALRWVEAKAEGRRFELFAEAHYEAARPFNSPRTSGLVRLLGADPNAEEGLTVPFGDFVKGE